MNVEINWAYFFIKFALFTMESHESKTTHFLQDQTTRKIPWTGINRGIRAVTCGPYDYSIHAFSSPIFFDGGLVCFFPRSLNFFFVFVRVGLGFFSFSHWNVSIRIHRRHS